MNKAELVNAMAAESGLSKVDSKKALEAFFSSIVKALSVGDRISSVGFGMSSVAERTEGSGINPSTREAIITPTREVAKLKPGAELAGAIK